MKHVALPILLASALVSLSSPVLAQTATGTDSIVNDPAQQEAQRTMEAAGSTTVVKETKTTVWDTPAGKQFMTAIEPRKNRWPDFDQIVFQSKVVYSEDMLGLISKSQYAADIAYYLGMHPQESARYANMPLEQSGPAILAIEQKAKTVGVKSVVEPVRP